MFSYYLLKFLPFIVIGAIFGVLFYFFHKYTNPYKLIFVFGKKGSGKSCYLVHEMLKHLKKGWTVYTDLPVTIPGIRVINAHDLTEFTPVSNSLICLDEVGLTWNNRNWKDFNQGLTEFIKLQRHFKVKLIINSQSFDVDKKVRDCTDSMILQSNIGNIVSVSRPIVRRITLTDPNFTNESKIVDALQFMPPISLLPFPRINWHFYIMPRYFKYFDSFVCPSRGAIPYRDSGVIDKSLTIKEVCRKYHVSRSLAKALLRA